jgi:hypothetical protein
VHSYSMLTLKKFYSTLFFHLSNQTDSNRLVKSFSKNIFKFLKIKLYTVNKNVKNKRCNYEMNLSKQVDLLNSMNILPIKLRFLRNFIRFLNSNLSNLPKTLLMAYILSFKKTFLLVLILLDFLSLKLNTINFLFLLNLLKFLIYFYLII